MKKTGVILTVLVGLAAGLMPAASAIEQPERPRAREGASPAREGGQRRGDQAGKATDQPQLPADAEAMRRRMVNSIEQARRQIERAEAAIEALESGTPVDQVREEFSADGRGNADRERERVRAFIREHMPRLWERIEPLEQRLPQGAERMLASMRPRILELIQLKRRHPELFELKLEDTRSMMMAMQTARDVRELRASGAPADEIAAAEAEVKELVGQSVDAQLKLKAHELETVGERLDRLQADLQTQTTDREKIIQQRTRRIMSLGQDRQQTPGQPGEQPRRRAAPK